MDPKYSFLLNSGCYTNMTERVTLSETLCKFFFPIIASNRCLSIDCNMQYFALQQYFTCTFSIKIFFSSVQSGMADIMLYFERCVDSMSVLHVNKSMLETLVSYSINMLVLTVFVLHVSDSILHHSAPVLEGDPNCKVRENGHHSSLHNIKDQSDTCNCSDWSVAVSLSHLVRTLVFTSSFTSVP